MPRGGITNKQTQENIRVVTESEIEGYDIEKLDLKLKKFAKLVSDCDDIISDCTENLQTAAKMDDIKESRELKSKINDASANREIFALKVRVVSLRIMQLKHEMAVALCGKSPVIPYGMDIMTFGMILDHIYNRTESLLIGNSKSPEGRKSASQIALVVKSNPTLKKYIKR